MKQYEATVGYLITPTFSKQPVKLSVLTRATLFHLFAEDPELVLH
jgi:hypothetical protein